MSLPVILLAIVLAIGFYILSVFNKFKTIDVRIKASIQEIGNQLKRQAEMIPNLVASVKGYMKHEQTALDKITDARKAIMEAVKTNDSQKLVDAASAMASALTPIKAVFESTPELKAAEPTQKLMDELRDTADKVMYSRRTLIDLTADYNTMVVTVPSSMVANAFKFTQKPGLKTADSGPQLEVSAKEMETPKVAL